MKPFSVSLLLKTCEVARRENARYDKYTFMTTLKSNEVELNSL